MGVVINKLKANLSSTGTGLAKWNWAWQKYNDLLDPVDSSVELQDAHLEKSFHDKPEDKDGDKEEDLIE